MSNVEQGIMNVEVWKSLLQVNCGKIIQLHGPYLASATNFYVKCGLTLFFPSQFDIPCSTFDIIFIFYSRLTPRNFKEKKYINGRGK